MNMRCVALLGRKDTPTDAVEEYCRYLAVALRSHGIALEVARVNWLEKGWGNALAELEIVARKEPETWFLVQYTALAWSRRGFSWRVQKVIGLLKKNGARVAMVFHDVEPYFGNRLIDRVRRRVQLRTMRNAMKAADAAIFTVAVEKIPWARGVRGKRVFIPVGANLPQPERAWTKTKASGGPPTVGVFSISDGRLGVGEAEAIAEAVGYAAEKMGVLRVVALGRNSDTAGKIVSERLAGKAIEVVTRGILSGEEVVNALGKCDAMLFVRGPISTRRGSAIAGIACGLPVIAREGWETAAPLTEAGVVLVPNATKPDFGPALGRVLEDSKYREELAERSRGAQRRYFSWQAIADQYAVLLKADDR